MSKIKINLKLIIGIIIGLTIGISLTVKATTIINSKDVDYNSISVKDALNVLFNKSNMEAPVIDESCKFVSTPNLGNDNTLIPVKIKDDGTVVKVSSSNENNEWYNYCRKQWANAVILNSKTTYDDGAIISEDNIESYFVWIPKYKYKLWNAFNEAGNEGVHSIEIIFDETNTVDSDTSCATPLNSGVSGNCQNGDYMTHPAFITLNKNGFWAGKFETGYKDATSVAAAESNTINVSKIIIKPNAISWHGINAYNSFINSYKYKRNLGSHMMKNTEWGAVAYLSHSIYGINREVNINNNSSLITGYSSLTTLDQSIYPGPTGNGDSYNKSYNNEIGYLASTTGNISGIYDMSGGTWEYVAAYVNGKVGSSGFKNESASSTAEDNINNPNYNIYFDKYTLSKTTYDNRILGDATGEMGPFSSHAFEDGARYINIWYSDFSRFLSSDVSWFGRGGCDSYGLLSGQFYFVSMNGRNFSINGYRITLSP